MVVEANKHRRPVSFAVGDLVWLKTDHLQIPSTSARKLAPCWVGPFPILQRITDVTYRLQLPEHWRIHPSFHVSVLKLHHGPAKPQQQPVFTVSGQDSKYEIERIIAHRLGAQDRLQYLVRWTGFDASEDMWLPEPKLGGAQRLMAKYKRDSGLI